MKISGVAELPLHRGGVPRWLFKRMVKLAEGIIAIIVEEYGEKEFLNRISDPYWFQAFGCVLGFDWHSSGLTTVTIAALKEALKPENHRLVVCGGKGKASKKTLEEIEKASKYFDFSNNIISKLEYASRMTAKVDNAAIQAGYPIYHHSMVISESGDWTVIQQGMNIEDKTARRYHWISNSVESFVVEPHKAIVGDVKRPVALNMTAKESEECRQVSVDLVKEKPEKIVRLLKNIRPVYQKSLIEWINERKNEPYVIKTLIMPRTLNWNALRKAYEIQPKNYEELLSIRGIGPATVRGLALISELVYGEPPSWKDPVKYSFAFGGKDGVPYPVNRKAMDEAITILMNALEEAKIKGKEKFNAIKRLRKLTSNWMG